MNFVLLEMFPAKHFFQKMFPMFGKKTFFIKEVQAHPWSYVYTETPAEFLGVAAVGSHFQCPCSLLWGWGSGWHLSSMQSRWLLLFIPDLPLVLSYFITFIFVLFFNPCECSFLLFALLLLLSPSSSPGKSAHAAKSRQHDKRGVWSSGDTSLER